MYSLEGQVGLVTGASRGIGRAIVIDLATHGARLALHARSITPEFREFALNLGGGTEGSRAFAADISDARAVTALFQEIQRWTPRLDFVVANAGVYAGSMSPEVTEAEWEAIWGTNLLGTFRTVQGALPLLAQSSNGSIVLVSSYLGSHAAPGGAAYQASKAGIEQVGRALALELAPRIRVNTVAPGFIRTDMNRDGHEDPAFRRHIEHATPLRRWGEPDDIAPVVRFLLSAEASWITGTTLLVDGGVSLE